MSGETAKETARRARAIWGYSLQHQDKLADEAGIHRDRLRAILAPRNPKRATPDELAALAAAVDGVPASFAAQGFDETDDNSPHAIWTELGRLRSQLQELTEAVASNNSPASIHEREGDALLSEEVVAQLLGPHLLAAAQALRKAEAQERQGEAERDRLRTSLGGST